jgi:hypothetical protein
MSGIVHLSAIWTAYQNRLVVHGLACYLLKRGSHLTRDFLAYHSLLPCVAYQSVYGHVKCIILAELLNLALSHSRLSHF